jgi:outer membrane protein assembly factor BamB
VQKGLYMMTFGENKLYRLDSASGSAGLIGSLTVSGMTDIAVQGTTMWGVSFTQFVRVDPQTAACTVIGNTGQSDINGLAVSIGGTIYAGGYNGNFYRINASTGAATVIGPFGGGRSMSGDLAIDSNDNVYAALNSGGTVVLAHVNVTNGSATVIGNIGFPTCYGLAFCCCRLYGVTNAGEVLTINVNTGAGTVIGQNGKTQGGLTCSECC